jgi:RNA polymerase sigma-70 factor (ECF subfamily)
VGTPASSSRAMDPAGATCSAPALDEEALLAGLRAGAVSAQEQLVRAFAGRIKAVAERYVRNEEDANDVVQETFLSAFKALASFAGNARLSTWLHRIAVNAALMRLRARSRRSEEAHAGELEDLLPRFVGLGAHATPQRAFTALPGEDLERAETQAHVRRCIDQLPETYRTALLLRDIEELENEEVAARLGVTVNAAKIRVHRARQALRTLLEPRFGVEA